MVTFFAILQRVTHGRVILLPALLVSAVLAGSVSLALLLACTSQAGSAHAATPDGPAPAALLALPVSTIIWQPATNFSHEPVFDDIAPAVHPTDALRALLSGPAPGLYTTDGGVSWQDAVGLNGLNAGVPAWLPGGNGESAVQVSLSGVSPQANLTPGPTGNALDFSRSTDGGANWAPPITLTIPGVAENMPYLWSDTNQSSPYYGHVYLTLTMLDAARTGSFDAVGVLRSSDGGATWSAPVGLVDPNEFANGTNYNAFASAAIQPSGAVVVAWHRGTCCGTITNVPNKVMWSRSTDGGVTFPVSGTIATVPISQSLQYNSFAPGNFRWTPAPNIAADPVDGTLYAAWVAYRQPNTPTSAAVYMSRSTDNGASWSPPVVVDNNGGYQYWYMPWVQVSPDHVVHVTYQGAILTDLVAHFYTQSSDRGATWSTPFNLSYNGYSYFGQGDYQATSLGGYNGSEGTVLTSWQIMIGSGVRAGTFPLGGSTPSPTPSPTPTCTAASSPGPWAVRANYPQTLGGVAVASDGSTVYGFAGWDYGWFNQSYKYNYATDSWTPIAPTLSSPGLSGAIYGHNGKIYAMGGGSNPGPSPNQIYDIASNSWSPGAALPEHMGGFASDYWSGKIYLIGGTASSVITNTAYAYDIATNSWSALAPLPRAEFGMASAAINGKIYVANGSPGSDIVLDNLYIYDIATNTWSVGAPSPLASYLAGGTAIGGKLYMIGGDPQGGGGHTSNTYIYDPATNSWSAGPSLNVSRSSGYAATINTPAGETAIVVGGYGAGASYLNSVEASAAPGVPCATATTGATSTVVAASPTAVPPTATFTRVIASATAAPPSNTVPAPSNTAVPPSSTPPVPSNTAAVPPTNTSVATPTPCTITFSDVPPGSTFYPYIHCLACLRIVSGYPDGTFRPGNNVTRGQLSKIVSNSASFNDIPTSQTFEDVPPGSTFYLYIERMASRGIIGGYPCGGPREPCVPPDNRPYFRPNNNATRGQIAKIDVLAAVQVLGWQLENPPTNTFQDVPVGSTFFEYVETAYSHGVLSGYQCGQPPAGQCVPPDNKPYFLWANNATRGQTAKIVANTFFPDCNSRGR